MTTSAAIRTAIQKPAPVVPSSIELRYGIEPALADRLATHGETSRVSRPSPDHAALGSDAWSSAEVSEASILVHLSSAGHGDKATVRAVLKRRHTELEMLRREVTLTVIRAGRWLHLDAHDFHDRRDGRSAILAVSIDADTGRAVYATSVIPRLLGLQGGTYNPPAITIHW